MQETAKRFLVTVQTVSCTTVVYPNCSPPKLLTSRVAWQGLGTMEMRLRLQRFIIEDRLVGAINKPLRFLARSFLHTEAADIPLVGGDLSTKREASKLAAGDAAAVCDDDSNVVEDSDSESMHSACSEMAFTGNASSNLSGAVDELPPAPPSVLPLAAVVRELLPSLLQLLQLHSSYIPVGCADQRDCTILFASY